MALYRHRQSYVRRFDVRCRFVASQVALNEGNALCGTQHVEPSDRDCRFAPPMMVHARSDAAESNPRSGATRRDVLAPHRLRNRLSVALTFGCGFDGGCLSRPLWHPTLRAPLIASDWCTTVGGASVWYAWGVHQSVPYRVRPSALARPPVWVTIPSQLSQRQWKIHSRPDALAPDPKRRFDVRLQVRCFTGCLERRPRPPWHPAR